MLQNRDDNLSNPVQRFSTRPSYRHTPGREPLSSLTIGQLLEQASKLWDNREAIVSLYQGHRLSFKDVNDQVYKLAAGFLELGLKRGDMLGIWGPNSLEWYLANLAATRAGLIAGTTGQPKAALLSHHNVVNNGYYIAKHLGLNSKHHRICVQVPFFHCYGNVAGILTGLHSGSTLVLPAPRFVPEASIDSINREKCSVVYGTPTMYVDVIAKLEETKTTLPSLESVVTGGAICPENLYKQIEDVLKPKRVTTIYGMTETSPVSFTPALDDSPAVCSTTVGKVMDHSEAKVVDANGKMVPMGQPGELWIRGYLTMLGYWGDEEKTKEVYGEGRWLKTGDQFVLREDGYGQIVGRTKDMIIRGGENIFPKEIEEYLQTHPAIAEVQVFGVPDKRMGEEICASIRLSEGNVVTEDDVRRYCKGKIAHFKIPKYIWFVTDFPKTVSGKIQKFKLQEMFLSNKTSKIKSYAVKVFTHNSGHGFHVIPRETGSMPELSSPSHQTTDVEDTHPRNMDVPDKNYSSEGQGSFSTQPSYWHTPGNEPLSPLTIGQLLEQTAKRWPDRKAIISVHQGYHLTFKEVNELVYKLAAGFLELGLKPGDMLGLWGPNTIEWYLTNFAAVRAGLIAVSINPAYQIPELKYCLTKVGIKALVTAEKFLTQNYTEMVKSLAPEIESCPPGKLKSKILPNLTSVIVMSQQQVPGFFRYSDVMEIASDNSLKEVHRLQDDIQPDEGCYLQFTSGTTGQPKGALLSHHNVVNNSYYLAKHLHLPSKHHHICLQVPLFHAFGNVIGLLCALHFGSTIVLPALRFDPEATIRSINQEKCSVLYGTPTMYVDVISKVEELNSSLSSLEVVLTAGAICPEDLFKRMENILKPKRVICLYGMTETSPGSFIPMLDDSRDICSTTVGKVMEHTEVKVVDASGKMVPMGQPGELWVRGYLTMLGYWGDDEKTKEIYAPGRWLKTGDQFILREDGYGQIVGRIKEMIIRGGENIFPKEIEENLQTHPDVLEAHVIGVPDERMGEEMCAFIRLSPGSTVTSDDIKRFCKGKIAHFKIPKYIWFVSEFPKTVSGKIQKFNLQEMFLKDNRSNVQN
ncbi:medium-chain acyl-CoA ligase ACSF2, mitochondrial [Anabrus simplex]|uniref:medium-chain acyl-CoA ligase ACSF2, mitochondrial n=1 Tax=Anabrus simplex TaxID=316456 RepID=UPI0035A28DBA